VLRPGVIDVSIGEPIASVGRDAEDLMREVETWIEAEMRRLDPEAYGGEPRIGALPRAS
jgi:1-acyl-sn-glycerol-3-phosphate acyltransferase